MLAENQKTDDLITERVAEINANFLKYLKIIAFSMIIPMWMVLFINGLTVLWKMMTWVKLDIKFWLIKTYSGLTFLLVIIPIAYLIWFYYLTIKRALLQIYQDLLLDWNTEIGTFCATYLMELEYGKKDNQNKFDIGVMLTYINKKLDYLPKALKWVVRKLMDEIPFVELVNSFDYEDLKAKNNKKLSSSITKKINEFELDYINSLVPRWFILLIPINIILLVSYIKL